MANQRPNLRVHCAQRRPLDPLYAERWQTTEVGARGGLEVRPPFAPHVAVSPAQYFSEFNAWFAKFGASATTERLKPAASHAKKAAILRQVCAVSMHACEGGCVWMSLSAVYRMHAAQRMRNPAEVVGGAVPTPLVNRCDVHVVVQFHPHLEGLGKGEQHAALVQAEA